MKIIELEEIVIPHHCFWFMIKDINEFKKIVNSSEDKIIFRVNLEVGKKLNSCLIYINSLFPDNVWVYDEVKNGKR